MIWTIREKGTIYFCTSDNKKFTKLKDATSYVASKFNQLLLDRDRYNVCYERSMKLKVIMAKM